MKVAPIYRLTGVLCLVFVFILAVLDRWVWATVFLILGMGFFT